MLTDLDLECEVATDGLNIGAVASYAYWVRGIKVGLEIS